MMARRETFHGKPCRSCGGTERYMDKTKACVPCQKASRKKNLEKTREKRKEYLKRYFQENKERRKECSREYYENNKDKIIEYQKLYREVNPDKIKKANENSRLKRRYGITLDEYEEMLKKQNSSCAICEEKPRKGRQLSVDHCHGHGHTRGLLCFRCNSWLAAVEDQEFVAKAKAYLAKHPPPD